MLRGIIFDLDGVVADSHPAHQQAWQLLLRALNRQVTDAELMFVMEGHKRAEILRHFLGDLTNEQIDFYGALKDCLYRHSGIELKTISGADWFLQQAETAGIPCAVASSASRARVENTLRQLNLRHRFRAVVAGDDVAHGKPDPSIFLLAAGQLNLSPDEVLVCEDAVNGVRAAKAAHMRCWALAAKGREQLLHDAGADKVFADFSAISADDLQALFRSACNFPSSQHSKI